MDLELMKKKLVERGYKITKQRELIFETLFESQEEHLSPEEIHELVSKKDSELGIATVYRTLQIFDMLSITRKHDFDDNRYRYELMLEKEDEHRHHHVVCKACGSIFEVKMDLLEDIENEISKKLDFEIADHDLVIYGTCSKCRNNIKKDDDMKEKVNKRVVK